MIKTGLPIIALAGAVVLGAQFTAVAPAQAACADDAMMVKEEAMAMADGDAKNMAIEHASMAADKAAGGMEDDCMAEVTMAKDAMMESDGMAKDAMDSMEKKSN